MLPQVSMMRDTEETFVVPGGGGEAELEGTRRTHEGPGRVERWAGFFIEYEPTKPAWFWSHQFPLRHRINCLLVVGAGNNALLNNSSPVLVFGRFLWPWKSPQLLPLWPSMSHFNEK